MPDQHNAGTFESAIAYEGGRIRAAAVYCSDGRLGEQFDDFLHNALHLPRYDRLAVPGGAACLADHFATYREGDAVAAQLEFLITVHQLQRVILIAHEDCAFYTERLRISPIAVPQKQREDLAKAVERVQQLGPNVVVEAYFARIEGSRIVFERVEV